MNRSDYIVYVDESGDHGLQSIDPEYPMFVLAFCVFRIQDYTDSITPAIQNLKFKYFGHDMVVLHEHEIRKRENHFRILMNEEIRNSFLQDLTNIVDAASFTIIAAAIRKYEFLKKHQDASNPYDMAMQFGLERIFKYLSSVNQSHRNTVVVFESRGKKEDDELELEFRRVCDGKNYRSEKFPFNILFANKQVNSTGLQLADLVARPIGRYLLNPDQKNRAYDILKKKIHKASSGEIEGFGLKIYP